MTAVLALLLDSYREMNSKKLFWITLALSGITVLMYGAMGFDETGITMFYGLWHIDSEPINSTTPWSRALYIGIFSDFIVGLWLTWIAIILALISTASIFPDLISQGSIDAVLSKPISRVKLFVVRYLGSLLFVLFQVLFFCVGIFLCVGLRLGEWNWLIFAAVPVVLLLFSYLYSFCVLIGIWTRSTLAAVLLTMLFWTSLWALQTTEGMLNNFRLMFQTEADFAEERVHELEQNLADLKRTDEPVIDETFRAQADRLEANIQSARAEVEESREAERKITNFHTPARWVMLILPKTQETASLISRWLKDPDGFSIAAMLRGDMSMGEGRSGGMGMSRVERESNRRLEADIDSRSWFVIIGSSLAFELVMLVLAGWLFVRRDY